jgi:hypothetical protein
MQGRPEDPLATLGRVLAAQEERCQAERDVRVAAAAKLTTSSRFGALWLVAKAIVYQERRDLRGRPSKAAMEASRHVGYVEGLRDAACALLGVNTGELEDALDQANNGTNYTDAANRIHTSPNMTLASHLP